MTKQVQYTSEFTIIDGKIEEFKRIMHSIIESVEKNEHDMNAYQVYFNAEENKAFIVEWFYLFATPVGERDVFDVEVGFGGFLGSFGGGGHDDLVLN